MLLSLMKAKSVLGVHENSIQSCTYLFKSPVCVSKFLIAAARDHNQVMAKVTTHLKVSSISLAPDTLDNVKV